MESNTLDATALTSEILNTSFPTDLSFNHIVDGNLNIIREPATFDTVSNYYPSGTKSVTHTVTYKVSDGYGNEATQTFDLQVNDSVIESFGVNDAEVYPSVNKLNMIAVGDVRQVEFTNPVTFIDVNNPQLESTITQESGYTENENNYIFTEIGKYNINYIVTDGAGNSQDADVIVKVYDTQELELQLSNTLELSGVESKTFDVSELTTETLNNAFPIALSLITQLMVV